MRSRLPWILNLTILLAFVASCGAESGGSSSGQISYKEVKSMVIDILGSEEAQQALEKASTGRYGDTTLLMKSMTPSDQQQVRIAVKDVLTSPEYSQVLETIMKDPKFAGEFAKAVSKDNKQIHKDLMKDPTYRQEMVGIFKGPEMQRILSDSTKTNEFRKQIMSNVTEAMQNPLFKLEIMKLLQTVVKEELTPKPTGKKQDEQSGGGQDSENGETGSPESSATASPSGSPESSSQSN